MKRKIYIKYFLIPLFAYLTFSSFKLYDDNDGKMVASEVISEIKYLSSEDLGGRFPGTHGDTLAEKYVIKRFKSYGLVPLGDDGYRQKFSYTAQIKLGPDNSFSTNIGGNSVSYKANEDYIPLGYSALSNIQGDLVFAGYGIKATDLNYNDFTGIDLKGKIAVIFAYSPGYSNPHDNPFSKYEQTRSKCNALSDAGAIGVIVVTGPESGEDELAKLRTSKENEKVSIPVISVKREIVEEMFRANGKILGEVEKNIDSLRTPNSFVLNGVSASMQTDLKYITAYTANIVGYIEGNDPVLKKEVIVIGAHLDHLGDGLEYGSLYDGHDARTHPGADDNASGCAGVMELAKHFSYVKDDLKRSYIFICFSGEEAGLIGSAFFVKSEVFKKYNITTMINMDMVGRLADNKLTIGGTGTSSIWPHLLDSLNGIYKFTPIYNKDGYGPTDHSSFYAKDMPVLFFFTGLHKDYHRPTDTWEKINADGEVRVLYMIASVIDYLDNSPSKPDFIKVQQDNPDQKSTGFRVTLGIIPDYSSSSDGLGITGIRSGGPADKAGILANDIIIKMGDIDIKNIYDYTDALSKFKPGDKTTVVVKRGTDTLTFNVEFKK